MVNIKGIYAALITPMDKQENLLEDSLRKLVKWQLEHGVEGFYICGSSGEGLLLSLNERKRILEIVLDEAAGQVPVIAHIGTIRTEDVIELATHAKISGAAAVSMIPPYYYKFTEQEIIKYYRDIMSSVDIPVLIYNIPAFTGIAFTKKNCDKLLSNDQLIGVKHTSMDFYNLERMKSAYPDKIYFNGYDEIFLSGLAAGATAAVGTTINLFPEIFKDIRNLFQNGKMSEAAKLQSQINMAVEIFVEVGIFNAVKYAFTLIGIDCGSCRKPFIPLNEEQKNKVKIVLADMDITF